MLIRESEVWGESLRRDAVVHSEWSKNCQEEHAPPRIDLADQSGSTSQQDNSNTPNRIHNLDEQNSEAKHRAGKQTPVGDVPQYKPEETTAIGGDLHPTVSKGKLRQSVDRPSARILSLLWYQSRSRLERAKSVNFLELAPVKKGREGNSFSPLGDDMGFSKPRAARPCRSPERLPTGQWGLGMASNSHNRDRFCGRT